jgi:hypothetical protein
VDTSAAQRIYTLLKLEDYEKKEEFAAVAKYTWASFILHKQRAAREISNFIDFGYEFFFATLLLKAAIKGLNNTRWTDKAMVQVCCISASQLSSREMLGNSWQQI